MKRPTICVTGATGRTGSAVVRQLREEQWPVRAVVRARDHRSRRLEQLGAEVVTADLFDAEQLTTAMRGARRAYFCPPVHPQMIQSAAAFAVAVQASKLESVVGLSQWLANPSHPSLLTRQHWLADRMLSSLPGVKLTVLNPGFFAEYPYLRLIGYAAHLGLFPMPGLGVSRNAPPSNDDIARVAVAALTDPDRHAGKTYRPTGPRLLSLVDMADILGRVVGRTVRHVNIPMWLFYKAVRADGASPLLMSGLGDYIREQSLGTFELGAPTEDVLQTTGRPAEDFETIARRHAALPEARRTAPNFLRALAAFLALPIRPGFNPARFDRRQDHPSPPNPMLSFESPQWREEHGIGPARDPLPPAENRGQNFPSPIFEGAIS